MRLWERAGDDGKQEERRVIAGPDPYLPRKAIREYDLKNVRVRELTFDYVPSVEAFDALLRLSHEIKARHLWPVLSAQLSGGVSVEFVRVSSGRHMGSYVTVKLRNDAATSKVEELRVIAGSVDAEIIAVDRAYRCGEIVKALQEEKKKGKK